MPLILCMLPHNAWCEEIQKGRNALCVPLPNLQGKLGLIWLMLTVSKRPKFCLDMNMKESGSVFVLATSLVILSFV